MANQEQWIWRDGEFVRAEQATIHIATHGLHYATAVFEGIRAYNGSAFLLEQHLQRLRNSTTDAGLGVLPYSLKQLSAVVLELMSRNGMMNGYIRPIVFHGREGNTPSALGVDRERGLSVAIMTVPWGTYLKGEDLKIRLCTEVLKPSPDSANPRVKSAANYGIAIQAVRKHKREGEAELIFCYRDPSSLKILLAEGAGCNIFLLHHGTLYTPRAGILAGLTRQTVIDIIESGEIDPNLEVREDDIDPQLLSQAEEVFLCGTAVEVSPVSAVAFGSSNEYKLVGRGVPGPVASTLRAHFSKLVHGELEQWRYLLTPSEQVKRNG